MQTSVIRPTHFLSVIFDTRSPPSIPSTSFLAHSHTTMRYKSSIRTIENAYIMGRTHPHVKNMFSLAIDIRHLHARSLPWSTFHRYYIFLPPSLSLHFSLILSHSHSFTLALFLSIQEKHHFIIQIRLVLNCLSRERNSSSRPHDRIRARSPLLVFFKDIERISSHSIPNSFSLYTGPFIVETRSVFTSTFAAISRRSISIALVYTAV